MIGWCRLSVTDESHFRLASRWLKLVVASLWSGDFLGRARNAIQRTRQVAIASQFATEYEWRRWFAYVRSLQSAGRHV